MKKVGWADHVRNEKALPRIKEKRNILQTIKRRKANRFGCLLRRSCLLNHDIERKIKGSMEVSGRRGRKRKQILDDLQEKSVYWKLKKEPVDCSLWRTRFGTDYGLVRQTTERMCDVDGARNAHDVCAQKKESERKRPLWRHKRK